MGAQVLWNAVLNYKLDLKLAFPPKKFPNVVPETFFCLNCQNFSSRVDLSVINGFLAASNSSICFLNLHKNENSCLILEILQYLLSTGVKYKPTDNFLHFTVLKSCLQKCVKIELSKNYPVYFQTFQENLWNCCLKIVHSYWDSRYSGVSELVVDIFKNFFILFHRDEENLKNNNYFQIVSRINFYLNEFPFFIRGKYKILAILVEFCTFSEVIIELLININLTMQIYIN